MPTTYASLGQEVLAQARAGDGALTNLRPLTQTLPLSYTISLSKYYGALGLTYTVQNANTAPLFVYYQVVPLAQFTVNRDGFLVRPDQVTYTSRPITNRTLIGGPLLQGTPQVVWSYSVLRIDEFDKLIGFYDPENPQVTITYPDENGMWVQRKAVMTPPNYGSRQTVFVYGATFTFLLPSTM